MGCIFDASRKVIKNFDSKIKGTFWITVKFSVGVCKSELNLVLILWISEFYSHESLFLATNNKRGKIYCNFNGRIFRFLNNWRQEYLFHSQESQSRGEAWLQHPLIFRKQFAKRPSQCNVKPRKTPLLCLNRTGKLTTEGMWVWELPMEYCARIRSLWKTAKRTFWGPSSSLGLGESRNIADIPEPPFRSVKDLSELTV
jgi:hypothetical protein